MNANKLKGSLLEFIIRRILQNSGFTTVLPDNFYIYETSGLTMINGKGAAHDADVLMDPPIQMPFMNPYRVNFECKSYSKKIGLDIIRGALGLRYDINDFEIINDRQLLLRRNTRRRSFAIHNRTRYNYQVGVASIEEFTKPAFEFAANNKIPLISLRWFLPSRVCDKFHLITDRYLSRFNPNILKKLHDLLKGKPNEIAENFLSDHDSYFKEILDACSSRLNNTFFGLIESGSIITIVAEDQSSINYIRDSNELTLFAKYRYDNNIPYLWEVEFENQSKLKFFLPKEITKTWSNSNYENTTAREIKRNNFDKLIIFTGNEYIPFKILRLDRNWLDNLPEE